MEFKVYYGFLLERAMWDRPIRSAFRVVEQATRRGFAQIQCSYGRTDRARTGFVDIFRNSPGERSPNDVLVMLDIDHDYYPDIVEKLAFTPPECGVVGALAFRREVAHPDPLYWRKEDGQIYQDIDVPGPEVGLLESVFVSTSAIAIKRWVFDKLEAAGYEAPFFRYLYHETVRGNHPTEDYYFAKICEAAGIPHYVNLAAEIPHVVARTITRKDWEAYVRDHPAEFADAEGGECDA